MRCIARRRFLLAAGALAATPRARAQARLPRLALLYPNPFVTAAGDARVYKGRWLAQLGWFAGRNLDVEHYSSDGREDRLPALAEEMVRKGADVIWVAGPEAALAAARATQTIPIAFYGVGYPVEHGLVDSLAKPGRNVTGLTSIAGHEWIKNLENLRQIAPGVRRLARLRVQTVAYDIHGREIEIRDVPMDTAAPGMGFEIAKFPVSVPEDLEGAFAAIRAWKPESFMCDFTAMTYRERHRIVDFANGHSLPSAYGALPYVEAGGLISYGAGRGWMARPSFTFVDRLLRGARPQELPVEQPTQFEIFINLKTARALGLEVPASLLLRADRVFE